ncbi:hypothetical protein ACKKBF_B01390 [Auxenochlorella protothecoides x Auxenochlorella symbiontica]
MYSVGIMPILVSAAAVFATTGQADMLRTLGLCLSSILIIAWLNLSNDYFDSLTGVDTHKYESWVNITRSPRTIFVTAHASLLAGAGMLFWLLSQSPAIASKMLYAAICCGYLYQGPPFRLSYQGLGEALCFVAFGPLAVNAFYLAQGAPALSTQSCILSVLVGVSTSAILFCSHFHQVKGDLAAGKRSPIVRLGTETGAQVPGEQTAARGGGVRMAASPCRTLSFPSTPAYIQNFHVCSRQTRPAHLSISHWANTLFPLSPLHHSLDACRCSR